MGEPKRWHKVTFVLIGIVMLGLIIAQSYRSSSVQKDLLVRLGVIQKNTERPSQVFGFLQFETLGLAVESAPLLSLGQNSFINVTYLNRGSQPVTGARAYTSMMISYKGDDTAVFDEFKREAQKNKAENQEGANVGVGRGLYSTVTTPKFTEKLISDLIREQSRFYILGHPYWNENAEGTYICLKLGTPTPSDVPIESTHMVWQICEIRKA